jgi:hypothetical protein
MFDDSNTMRSREIRSKTEITSSLTTAAIRISGTGPVAEGGPAAPRCTGVRVAEWAVGNDAQRAAANSSDAPPKRHAPIVDP